MTKITRITTTRVAQWPKLIWIEIETDDGLTGLGETFWGAQAVEGWLHEQVAPWLLGQDARHIEAISRHLMSVYLGFNSASAEVRAASAVDIALWDLAGQRHGIPVHEALGGASRSQIQVYNTCAGYQYNTGLKKRVTSGTEQSEGPYDDQVAFMRDAGRLADSLRSEGYRGMKIWPLDRYAEATGGNYIGLADLKAGIEPFRKIRAAVGDDMEIMVELHSLWTANAALRICRALEDVGVFWVEDPLNKMDDAQALADLRRRMSVPVCGSETLAGLKPFRELLAADALDVVMIDLPWCGGLTEGRKIAALAQARGKPVAPHDCTGPITLISGLHLAMHATTAIYQEVVRATLDSWYGEIVTELPVVRDGMLRAPTAPGLGTALNPKLKHRADAHVRVSTAQ